MTCTQWTVLDCERTTDHESALFTLTLEHGPYTAYVSIRPLDGAPHYHVLKTRVRRPPVTVWPRPADKPALDKRSALYEPLQQLHTLWTGNVCSLAVHAYLDTHSPYCLPACPVPVHVPVQAQSTTHSTQQDTQP